MAPRTRSCWSFCTFLRLIQYRPTEAQTLPQNKPTVVSIKHEAQGIHPVFLLPAGVVHSCCSLPRQKNLQSILASHTYAAECQRKKNTSTRVGTKHVSVTLTVPRPVTVVRTLSIPPCSTASDTAPLNAARCKRQALLAPPELQTHKVLVTLKILRNLCILLLNSGILPTFLSPSTRSSMDALKL